ncbi:MBL fold metallo-hydrolase [Gymnodinialimonas hymeniacidonis]|uniref:MBL fold metallo-hydrolase n=1 Tax=Gymnodinialimonas hymeniacidonis TaxID=3126508 RepID=UPI0034C6DD72
MFLLDRRTFVQLTAATAGAASLWPASANAAPTGAEVFTGDAMGGNVDSVVLMGDSTALLVDTQFTEDNATRLADVIEATGRTLETVFITHAHPDHYSGLPIIRARFPGLRAVAHPDVLALLPVDDIGGVEALDGPLMLEGEEIEVLGPMHGDTDVITPLYVPALDTLIAADMAYVDCHVWVAENTTAERINLWRANLDTLEAMGAATVIPGHRLDSSANDAGVFAYTRAYLAVWEQALAETSSAEELTARMMEGREDLGLAFAVQMAVGAVYPE